MCSTFLVRCKKEFGFRGSIQNRRTHCTKYSNSLHVVPARRYASGSGTSDATPQIISAMFRPARKATGMPCPV
jgi:hypothetical protein